MSDSNNVDSSAIDSSAADDKQHPSMIGGHAKYLQGAIASTFGYGSGDATKRAAIDEMRRASVTEESAQPVQSNILGTVEKKIGELTGCEGMEKEGDQRMVAQAGSEETSGTG